MTQMLALALAGVIGISILPFVAGVMTGKYQTSILASLRTGLAWCRYISRRNVTKRMDISGVEIASQQPPRFAEYLLYFLPKKDRELLRGDLEEEFHTLCTKFGRGHAKFWYTCQVGLSFLPYIVRAIKQLIGWGVVGWVGNWIRRLVQ